MTKKTPTLPGVIGIPGITPIIPPGRPTDAGHIKNVGEGKRPVSTKPGSGRGGGGSGGGTGGSGTGGSGSSGGGSGGSGGGSNPAI
jgi:hypothetical protein